MSAFRMTTVGWQWTCVQAEEPNSCDDPEPSFGDTWQNPDQEQAVLLAARRHADRTGHATIVEKHMRGKMEPRRPRHG